MEVEVDVVLRGDAGNAFCAQVAENRVGTVDMGKGTVSTCVDTVRGSVNGDTVVEDDGLKKDRVVGVKDGPIFS